MSKICPLSSSVLEQVQICDSKVNPQRVESMAKGPSPQGHESESTECESESESTQYEFVYLVQVRARSMLLITKFVDIIQICDAIK